jgi:hypothetical protein
MVTYRRSAPTRPPKIGAVAMQGNPKVNIAVVQMDCVVGEITRVVDAAPPSGAPT